MAGGRGEGLPVFLGKPGGAAAWMICHGRQGRKPGGLPVIDHGSQSPDQYARRDARKKSKKNKNRACVSWKPCYIFDVCSARQTGLLSHAGLPNPQKPGNREPPKENFFILGYNACLRETDLVSRQGVAAPTANRLFLYSRRKHHEQG